MRETSIFGVPEDTSTIELFFRRPRGATSVKFKYTNNDFGKAFIRYADRFELCYIMRCKCGAWYPSVIERRRKV